MDLKTQSPAEKKIRKALDSPTSLEFTETPLNDVIDYLKDLHNIEIQVDNKALDEAGVASDTAITKSLKGISLRSALRLMLGPLELSYVIKDEVLLITTKEKAENELVTKVYPVADLVLPIRQSGMMGGFGGMGGMSGGMGGMMGGGGMGGMGGRGGGMGGWNGRRHGRWHGRRRNGRLLRRAGCRDQGCRRHYPAAGRSGQGTLKLGGGKPARDVRLWLNRLRAAAGQLAPAHPAKAATAVKPIRLTAPADGNWDVAWNNYFAQHDDVSDAIVRETARELMVAHQFESLVGMMQAALRAGLPQPWMYEALGLAMQASHRPQAEIERALMSGVDLGENPEDLMYVAQYMARSGLEARALKLFRQVSIVEPLRPEPYVYGLQLAQRLNQLEAVQWSSLGILRQAWPNDKTDVWQTGLRAAVATLEQLKSDKRSAEAAEFQREIDKALQRDCIVRVTWTGDADVDLYVEEPSGTICSFRNPRTTSGGVMMGDNASHKAQATREGFSEVYVCPEAFSGNYRVLIRRVWGKVTAGKVTVDVYSHYGTNQVRHMRDQVALAGDQDAAVAFELQDGRRLDPLKQQMVANAVVNQVNLNQAVLAQQLHNLAASNNAGANLGLSRVGLLGGFNGPFLRGAVGYMPLIITLPTGANMSATGVISADRRYVRITAVPLFSQIGQVTTFNIASGKVGNSPTPAAGGGGVAAGGGAAGAGGNGGVGNGGGGIRPGGGGGGVF